MQDVVLKILIELYLEREWTRVKKPPQSLFKYVDVKREQDHKGKMIPFYMINPLGIFEIEKWMRSMGRAIGPNNGIAVQRRRWEHTKSHNFTVRQVTSAFSKFCKMAEVPMEYSKDQYGRRVITVKDIDVMLSRVGFKIKWETHGRSEIYLKKKLKWSNHVIWLWLWLDKIRSDLRQIPLQQEFVVWESS